MTTTPLKRPETTDKQKTGSPDRWKVVLWNDDHNDMQHVVHALMAVCGLDGETAVQVMMTAHHHGSAVAKVCHKELAEAYREGLESHGLTATIEPE